MLYQRLSDENTSTNNQHKNGSNLMILYEMREDRKNIDQGISKNWDKNRSFHKFKNR